MGEVAAFVAEMDVALGVLSDEGAVIKKLREVRVEPLVLQQTFTAVLEWPKLVAEMQRQMKKANGSCTLNTYTICIQALYTLQPS